MAHDVEADRRFLEEALARGGMTAEQVEHCRRILATLAEVDVSLSAAEVAIRKAHLTKETADQIKRALARKRVGRYEVLDRLGRGGSGVVWRARDTRLGRIVALKLLARPRADDDVLTTYHARFQREARTAVTLNHVNIVRGLDYGESDGYVFFAMEFVSGETAAERLRREGRIAEHDAIQIALQVVEALEYVSRFDLVHRDLKPANLLLTAAGEVKVCDLGLAKPTLEEASRMGASSAIAGTPLYMAPEQIKAPESIDWRTDVYGLGATLYHLITGRPPFVAHGDRSVIDQLLHDAAVDPREHILELSAGASAVVLKMLAKDPQRRYSSLADLGSDLAAVVENRPPSFALSMTSGSEGAVAEVLAETQGARARLGPGRGRVRRVAALLLVAAAVSAVALGVAERTKPPTEDPARRERQSAAVDSPPAAGDVQRTPVGPVAPPLDPGRGALALAREMEREDEPLDALIEQWRHVSETFGDHPSGRTAATRLEELKIVLGGRAAQELLDRRQAAAHRLKTGSYAAAIEELEVFPALYVETAAYDEAMDEARRLRVQGGDLQRELLDDALVAAVDGRFDDARANVEAARRVGLVGLERAIAIAEKEIALEQDTYRALRLEQTPGYLSAAGRALMASYDDEVEAARIVDIAEARLRTYAGELAALRSWLPLARRARVRLSTTWQMWAREGKGMEFRSVGHPERECVGRPVESTDGQLTLSSGGDGVVVLRSEELPKSVLAEAISPGAKEDISRLDEVAAFLLSLRRLADAAAFSAPPELVDAVRAAAIADVRVRLERIEVLVDQSDLVAARDAVNSAIRYAPWCAAPWTALGGLRTRSGDLDGAIDAYGRALASVPPDPAAHLGIAAVYERRRRYVEAEQHLRAFLVATQGTADERFAALRPDAEQALDKVSAERLKRALATLFASARKARREGRTGDQKADLEQILRLRPDDPEALYELARLFVDEHRVFPAYKSLRRLVAAHPEHRRAAAAQIELEKLRLSRGSVAAGREALLKGRTAFADQRLGDAISAFRSAIQLLPFLLEAHLGLATALEARGIETAVRDDVQAAVEAASDAYLIDPTFVQALLVRARAHLELSDLDAALADAALAAQAKSVTVQAEAHIVAGRALLGLDRVRDAFERFGQAYGVHEFADPIYWQAVALERRGERIGAKLKLDFLYDQWGAPPHLRERIERLDTMLAE